jgi:tRNA-specific 2-thiouridylase
MSSLLKAKDRDKDQSYFLARLDQQQLSRAVFPLGILTKKEVREKAQIWGMRSFQQKESQELCFVRYDSYKEFLAERAKLPNEPGPVVDTQGNVIGRHGGLHGYTVGQRKGIGIPGPFPYYVIRLERNGNRLVVGAKAELEGWECAVNDINWIENRPPEKAVSVQTRIRYRHREADSVLTPLDSDRAIVRFSKAQYAITPGQAAVFYEGERVIGGGWIE